MKQSVILLLGGGDLASGVAMRLFRVGLKVLITELPRPLAVRRLVSFAEAVYRGEFQVEEITARRAESLDDGVRILDRGDIPVLIDPEGRCREIYRPMVLVDARMTKLTPGIGMDAARLVIGLGPGFIAGENCHAVIETQRGHTLGRVIREGGPAPDTGIPEAVFQHAGDRVLRAPSDGVIRTQVEIGARVEVGHLIADVNGHAVRAPFSGVVRGLLYPGLEVQTGMKIGDIDPRADPSLCRLVSEKALAIGGGVLEAILSENALRLLLWS